MLKTKKITFAAAFFLAALITIMPLLSVNAAASSDIYDGVKTRSGTYSVALLDADFYDSYNGCLTQPQETEILELMQETAEKIECNIGIAIVSDLHGMSYTKYTERFSDEMFGAGSSSIVLMLLNSHDNPKYANDKDCISRSGLAQDYYDKHVDKIFDKMYEGLDKQGFSGACRNFCSALRSYRSSGSYSSGDSFLHIDITLILFMLIGGVVMSIVIVSMCRKGYKKKTPISAAHYIDKNRTRIDRQVDQFVREYTTSVRLSSSSSGGGHGGHHSSGGSHRSGGHHSSGGRHR